jgi:hypothetical protein
LSFRYSARFARVKYGRDSRSFIIFLFLKTNEIIGI